MSHRYEAGEQISLAFGFYDHSGTGIFAVVRRLPSVIGGEPQYVVRGGDDRQRVIGEAQIAAAPGELKVRWPLRRAHNPITRALNELPVGLAEQGSLS